MRLSSTVRSRARKVRLVLLDVDGVLTDGRIYYVPRPQGGLTETKTFHSRDGLGIRLAHAAGLRTGIISGRGSPIVEYRAKELGIHFVQQGALEKVTPYERMLRQADVRDENVCFVGDDIVDLPILKRVGFAVGVGDGHPFLRRHVHYWTRHPGGSGAVREAIEVILEAQGKLEEILTHFLTRAPKAVSG
jgi:3-deoxy-D-manno-octulosonate 8-phosphate phosphatase (KDO 8-P phosphatase)